MKRLTPQEFLNKWYPAGLPVANFQWEEDMPEIMERYAEHLEETAWVKDGSLPPVDPEDREFSQTVLADYETGQVVVYVNLRGNSWYNAKSHDSIAPPMAWRPLPNQP